MYFTWMFSFYATLYLYSTPFEREIYFLLRYIH